MSLSTVSIPHIEVKVCSPKSEFLQGGFLSYLTTPEITRQITFKIKDIEYDRIKD